MNLQYEAVSRANSTSDRPPDYDIKAVGAGAGTGRIATVYGRYGRDALATAAIIVNALNGRIV